MLRLEAIMPSAEGVGCLVNLAVAGSLVCGAGLLAARACRRASAPLRHGILVWTLALILLSPAAVWLAQQNGLVLVRLTVSAPPAPEHAEHKRSGGTGILPVQKAGTGETPVTPAAAETAPPSVPPPGSSTMRSRPAFSGRPSDVPSASSPLSAASSALREASPSAAGEAAVFGREDSPGPAWWQVAGSLAALLWAVGAAFGLFRLGWGCVALARFCRRLAPLPDPRQKSLARQAAQSLGLREPPPVFLSRRASAPVSIGLLKAAIVLPEPMARETDDDQLQAVLLHEMAHIARRDHWVGVGQRIAAVLFWWNPLVHRLCDQLAELREQICDNHVVLVQGEGQRLARILVDLAARAAMRPLWPSTVGVLEPRLVGLSARVARLVDKEQNMETRMNLRSKVLLSACGLVVLLGLASIAGLRLAYGQPAPEPQPAAADQPAASSAGATGVSPVPVGSTGKMPVPPERPGDAFEFRGQVVDPDGKPLQGANLYLVQVAREKGPPPKLRATSGPDGNFRFSMAKSEFDSLKAGQPGEMSLIVALADGYGPDFHAACVFDQSGEILKSLVEAYPNDAPPAWLLKPLLWLTSALRLAALRLAKDDVPLVGRVADANGRPVAGAKVSVLEIITTENDDLSGFLGAVEKEQADFNTARTHLGKSIFGEELPGVMPTATSDADGKFRLTGIGRERIAELVIGGPGIESSKVYARTRPGPTLQVPPQDTLKQVLEKLTIYGADFEHVARPSIPVVGTVRAITGTVQDKDTGKPLPAVTIQCNKLAGNPLHGEGGDIIRTTTDAQGHYRLTGMRVGKDNELLAVPPLDQPYLLSLKEVEIPADKDSLQVDFELKRGVWIRGRVTDAKTGEPLRQAVVEYYVFLDNPHYKSAPGFGGAHVLGRYRTDKEGRYAIPALPGRGIVGVQAHGDEESRYPQGAGAEKITGAERPRGAMAFFRCAPGWCLPDGLNALAEVNLAEGAESAEQDFPLDPGQTVTGTVRDPAGKPLVGAFYTGSTEMADWKPLKSEEFAINCYRPDQPRVLLFVHLERKLAGGRIVEGGQPAPLAVQLQPWGTVTGRVADPEGKPWESIHVQGRHSFDPRDPRTGDLPSDLFVKAPDGRLRRQRRFYQTDQDGRFHIDGLAPGIQYRLEAEADGHILGTLIAAVTIESGQTKDLGNLTLKLSGAAERRVKSRSGSSPSGAPAEKPPAKPAAAKPSAPATSLLDALSRAITGGGLPKRPGD